MLGEFKEGGNIGNMCFVLRWVREVEVCLVFFFGWDLGELFLFFVVWYRRRVSK